MATNKATDGYVWTNFRADENDRITVKDSLTKKDVILEQPRLQVPVTDEAVDAACKDYTFIVVDIDGVEHKLTGTKAAAVAKYWHGAESVIGLARAKKSKKGIISGLSAKQVLERMAELVSLGGRSRGGSRQIEESELDGLSVKQIKELLKARGFVAAGRVTEENVNA